MLWKLDETALDLFARRPSRGFRCGVRFVDDAAASPTDGFQPRQAVELVGAAGPKLLVLLHVVAAFLLRPLEGGGARSDDVVDDDDASAIDALRRATDRVVLFDHEMDVDARQLRAVLCAKLLARVRDPEQRMAAARRAMDRVTVYNCRDTFQWLATLNQLHFELMDAPTAPLLMVIHCVSSFHAIDKMTAKSVGDGLALTEQAFLFLKQFSRHHSPIIFATKETPAGSHSRNGWESPEFMPASWSSQVSKRILLRSTPSPTRRSNSAQGFKDEAPSALFEAKCIVRGESRVYSCRLRGCEIDVVDQQSSSRLDQHSA